MEIEYTPEMIDLIDVPRSFKQQGSVWKQRFEEIPDGKAVMLQYNTRQRAHQVAQTIRSSAKYWKIAISTRIIHAEPIIHDTDGWLVYFWRKIEK